MGGIVATVLRKYNLSQIATDISHVAPSPPVCVMRIATALMSALGLYRGLLLSKPRAGSSSSLFHDLAIKKILQAALGARAMTCSSGISHPHAAPGTEWGPEMVIRLESIGYSDLIECNNDCKKHLHSAFYVPGVAVSVLVMLTHLIL